ncbi:uncharacterized protein LOC121639882 [Melanotaenia boesemani]|uniref:uncharacterized protein LOC121639882 n=1 Tax=Melanotaenia boesemani TaxID=1250792 RepID=UPI001C054806|nr:uncharacterized protein LOC121639882 [Melanotaenia boesemani]
MMSLTFASYLTCVFLWKTALASDSMSSLHVRTESGFISAKVGDNVTLQCFYGNSFLMFHWYKQALGQRPKLVSTLYKHDENGTFNDEFKNPRFSLETKNGKNHLTISDLLISDSATYYCISCHAYEFEFTEGITVSVKGSGLDVKVLVHQPESETIQPGGSKTLDCTVHTGTCDGEHSVYWFKVSEDSHPGLIYTHGGRNDQCEKKPDTQTNTCVYNLPMKTLNISDAGTYYCAVASCGQILFGNRIKLESADELNYPDFLIKFLTGALTFTTILTALMAFSVYKMKKRIHDQCAAESHPRCSDPTAADPEREDGLHYAALKKQRFNQSRRPKDELPTHCVYSTVRQ